MRVGQAAIAMLEANGVDTIFGIPGVHTIELYRGLAGSQIHAVTARHEQGAAFMADGYARVTGKPGVCVLISGPGVTNAATAIAQAYHDSVPLLILASTTASTDLGQNLGPLHDLQDQAELLRTITASSRTVTDPEDLPSAMADAFASFTGTRRRPVHIAIPHDLLGHEAPDTTAGRAREPTRAVLDQPALDAAIELLSRSEQPVILLGGGGVDAGPQVQELAETLDAPVALTGNARGVVSSDHPLCLGATLPMPSIQKLIESSDVALIVGSELSETDVLYTGSPVPLPRTVIRIDLDADQLERTVRPTVGLHGDAAAVCGAIADQLHSTGAAARQGEERVASALADLDWSPATRAHVPWLEAIERALPEDRIVAVDSTQLAYSAHHYLPERHPRSWLAPYGFGTLGTALPMAIGAKVGQPERAVAAIAGDGGILFTLPELATAVDLGLDLPVIVWDNRGYGEIRDSFDRADAPRLGTETTAADLLTIAKGFGCATVDVTEPQQLTRALESSLSAGRPTVLRIAAA